MYVAADYQGDLGAAEKLSDNLTSALLTTQAGTFVEKQHVWRRIEDLPGEHQELVFRPAAPFLGIAHDEADSPDPQAIDFDDFPVEEVR